MLQRLLPFLFLLFTLFTSAFAQTDTSTIIAYSRTITAQSGILGGLLIASGLFLVFFGLKLYKPVVFIAGVFVGATLTYIILANLEPVAGYVNRDTVYLTGCLAVGFVLGLLLVCFVKIGIVAVGAWAGFLLSIWVLSWKSDGVIDSQAGRIIFICVVTALGAVMIMFFQKSVMITATSFSGAFM
jgi:Domain of unknown function (DUF4203)